MLAIQITNHLRTAIDKTLADINVLSKKIPERQRLLSLTTLSSSSDTAKRRPFIAENGCSAYRPQLKGASESPDKGAFDFNHGDFSTGVRESRDADLTAERYSSLLSAAQTFAHQILVSERSVPTSRITQGNESSIRVGSGNYQGLTPSKCHEILESRHASESENVLVHVIYFIRLGHEFPNQPKM